MKLQPSEPAVHFNHGVELLAVGRSAEALASFQSSLALQPGQALAHHNSGLGLMSLERYTEARDSFYRALGLAPNAIPTLLWLSKACMQLGQSAEALATLDRAVAQAPQAFDVHFQRGIVLATLERHEESAASFDKAVALNSSSPEAVNNRGAVLMRLFRPAQALQDFSRATALRPEYADAYTNAGNARRGLGQYVEALDCVDRALSIKPGDPTATWSKAILKLAMGDFEAGWPLYESRFLLHRATGARRSFARPRWQGNESIAGKTLLVHADQGLGDTLQFCRYIPLLEAMGANVVFEVQRVLKQLLGSLAIRGSLLGRGEPLPEFDLHSPLASLPLALGTRMDTIPAGVPYLSAAAQAVHSWKRRLDELPGFRVGLNWQGDLAAEKLSALEARSFPLAAAAALARAKGVSLVSLQKGAGSEQRLQVEFGPRLAQLTDPQHMGADEIAEETAALIKGLDLIITADTAVAHLAGALGARVWVVLQAVPDWRWLIDRSDSPWYPTMRLFRQSTPGDWQEVFERIATEIATFVGQGQRP
jgi:tetratricopeptide (TPR) repeat protein